MSKTVFFRAFEEDDADLIYQWMNDDDLKKLSIGLNRRMCRNEALEWVKSRMAHNNYQVLWAICTKDTGKLIGYTFLTNIHYINLSAEFGGIVIGDKDYQDGFAWIETYLFVYEYAFERLGLNRVYGYALVEHHTSRTIANVMFASVEGILRKAIYKNGVYHDMTIGSLLSEAYFEHKANGDYAINKILKRLREKVKDGRKDS
jgi:RimJ/RimL family protein N-acetyltransferase